MKSLRLILIAAALSFTLASNAGARAHERPGASVFQAGGVSLDQAIAMVQSRYGAKVMRANTVEEGGRTVHYIRLMSTDSSRVWTVRVDAATGREF
jgi:uncharacterized membrane protein YkoI